MSIQKQMQGLSMVMEQALPIINIIKLENGDKKRERPEDNRTEETYK